MNRSFAAVFLVACLLAAVPGAQSVGAGPVAFWSGDDLKSGRASGLPLTTPTHRFSVMKIAPGSAPVGPQSHEGATNIFFVLSGQAEIYVGTSIERGAPLPSLPGEIRGGSIAQPRVFTIQPGAVINIPASAAYALSGSREGVTLVRLEVNVGMHPWSIVSTQHNTLAETATHPRVVVPLNSTQGDVKVWSAEQLQKAHTTMAAAAAKGAPMNDPRDLVEIPATRTHAFNFLHRVMGANGRLPGVEYHGGNTDIYFITAGTGTVMTGGTIENREPIPNRPLEERGTLIKNGVGYKVKAGDVINMPPNTAHQSIPDPGGFSYMLIKVNTGQYPWELIK